MPPRQRITVYPSRTALRIVGVRSPELNRAIECWAAAIQRASLDNAGTFDRQDWGYLADATAATPWTPGDLSPAAAVAEEVDNGNKLDALGKKWYGKASAALRVVELKEKVLSLDYLHAWAVVVVCQRFWDRSRDVEVTSEEWWKL